MNRFVRILFISTILSCVLAGCCFSLPPSPQKLLSVFCGPFVCTVRLSFADSGSSHTAALVRSDTADTLTVRGDVCDTVLISRSGQTLLNVRGTDTLPPLSLPLPASDLGGVTAVLPLFSVLPDKTFSSAYADGEIIVTNADGTYQAIFDPDGIPIRITYNGLTAVIEAFSAEAHGPQ